MELRTGRGGLCPLPTPPSKFFKILNSRYIFKILENTPKKIIFAPLNFDSQFRPVKNLIQFIITLFLNLCYVKPGSTKASVLTKKESQRKLKMFSSSNPSTALGFHMTHRLFTFMDSISLQVPRYHIYNNTFKRCVQVFAQKKKKIWFKLHLV